MTKYTQKQLKSLTNGGAAIDVTNAGARDAIPESYSQIGYASGVYGCNGMLLKGDTTDKLYAVTARTAAIYIF